MFRPGGLRNCTMHAEDTATGSLWYSAHGMAISGTHKGKYLPVVPSYHVTFSEWLALHPDTDVVAPPDDPIHRDIRYGHGTFEALGRPGLAKHTVMYTLSPPIDFRLPENTLVLGVTCGPAMRVYPMAEVRRNGSVVNDELAGEPVLVIAGPAIDSAHMGAFSRVLNDRILEFAYDGEAGQYLDQQTGSRWTIEGKAVEGPLAGSQLELIDSSYVRWHGWAFSHKDTEIFFSKAEPAVNPGDFADVLQGLMSRRYRVVLEDRVLYMQLPNEATEGLTLHINGDRFRLSRFPSAAAAEDYAFARPHTLRADNCLLQSSPEDRQMYADKLFTMRKRDELIDWSTMLSPSKMNVAAQQFIDDFLDLFPGHDSEEPGEMKKVYLALQDREFEVAVNVDRSDAIDRGVVPEIYRFQLPVNCLSGRTILINSDEFILYKFRDKSSASRYAEGIQNTLQSGRFLLRSTPPDMYYQAGFGERPVNEVSWSKLVEDKSLQQALDEVCGQL